jgi:hypothetical protein
MTFKKIKCESAFIRVNPRRRKFFWGECGALALQKPKSTTEAQRHGEKKVLIRVIRVNLRRRI